MAYCFCEQPTEAVDKLCTASSYFQVGRIGGYRYQSHRYSIFPSISISVGYDNGTICTYILDYTE